MNINWYPGHMKKTIESLKKMKSMVDTAVVLLDARIPESSYNPLLGEILGDLPTVYLLNKSDLANPSATEAWIRQIRSEEGKWALAWTASKKPAIADLTAALEKSVSKMRAKEAAKGMQKRKIKVMVTGIPNVGKSTFINQIAGKKSAAIGNRPGITKSNQWIRHNPNFDMLDTPGVLWPKLDPPIRGRHLAFTGSIKEEIVDTETLAFELVKEAVASFPEHLRGRYGLSEDLSDPVEIMDAVGKKRGALLRGGLIDYTKVSRILLDEFRNGVWGRITLEHGDDRSSL
ncbi:Ribosome biogenesis GTPase A [Aedoeadaptatus ivorii]|uniref:Ribosome biogenesis GTPase A n=1 Tax=Aedoeadaptatus ivorii TaxID=54006 RepID=A0A448V184_9FIRM|nr:ribosome biogenesis GTPase YlqF [Peptoniphilus ivorii]VEJ35527.1 Ribosome biogenesis GTPase A [Peptoniphilus ivorii]